MKLIPIVSVITPNYNGERFIRRVVESVRRQNFSLEHIIVDDCSKDGSWELLQELAKEFDWIKPVRLEQNSGPILARNKAIDLAQGRFLAFLDVDDFWLPQKLCLQIKFMLDTDCALSFTDYRLVTEDGHKIGRRLQGFKRVGWNLHHMTRYVGCLTVVLDRSKISDFRFPHISPAIRAEDFLAWSNCISTSGPALRCPYDLARYAVVANSRSSNTIHSFISVWNIYHVVERIRFWNAVIYFFSYACSSAWKKFKFKPTFSRNIVDDDYEWSIIR